MLSPHNFYVQPMVEHYDINGNLKKVHYVNAANDADSNICVQTKSKAGTVITDDIFPIRSFTRNWVSYHYSNMKNALPTTNTFYDITGSHIGVNPGSCAIDLEHSYGASYDNKGIVLGTDDGSITPMGYNNYALGAIIDHGNTSGTMEYGTSDFVSFTEGASEDTITLFRLCTNHSGGTITVKEVGLVGWYGASWGWLYARDLTDAGGNPINIPVLNNTCVNVTYNVKFSEASGFTHNYIRALQASFRNDSSESYTDTSGASRSGMGSTTFQYWLEADAGAAENTWGLKIGTSNAALDISHYRLQSSINHGTGAGQMSHGLSEITWLGTTGQTTSFKCARPFTNNSGGAIAVEEMAWYAKGSTYQVMIGRWITGTLNVLPGESIKPSITYAVTSA